MTGFSNIGAEAGLTGGGILPLERLVMAAPRMIVTSSPYPGASRSEEILVHPALAAVRAKAGEARVTRCRLGLRHAASCCAPWPTWRRRGGGCE